MVLPQMRRGMKNVFGFFIYLFHGRWKERQTCHHLFVCHTSAHSPDTHTHTHTPSVKRTPTYVAGVLMDEMRGGPRLPKCRQWTDCGEVMNG